MSSVRDVCKAINKAWKEEVVTSGNFVRPVEHLSSGDLSFDYCTFGGVPEGSLITLSGLEFSGKTVAACQLMAAYQKKHPDRVNIFVDGENSLLVQGEWLSKMTGLDMDSDNFVRYSMAGKSAEELFADLIKIEEADDCGCICIDSLPVLISTADLDNDFEKDNGMRGSISKSLIKFTKHMLMYLPKRNNILIYINQVREDGKNFMGVPIYREACGSAPRYFSSMYLRFGTRSYTLGDKTDISSSKGEGADGFRLKFNITKNRLGPVNRGGGFLTYRYDTGLDDVFDLLEVAIKFDFIHRPNAQTYELVNLETGEMYTDENGDPLKFRGKAKLTEYLDEHPEFKAEYVAMLKNYISQNSGGKSLLDEKDLKEIMDQESLVTGKAPETEEELEKETEEENE